MPTVVTRVVNAGVLLAFFQRNGMYWMVLENGASAAVEVWSSPTGTSWAQVGGEGPDAGGWPIQPMCAVWDGVNTITLAYQQGNFSGNSFLSQFNLTTGTWGAPFAEQSGGVPGNAVYLQVFVASNGNIVTVMADQTAAPFAYFTQTWNGASWSAAVNICATCEALPGFNVSLFTVQNSALDSNNVLHTIFSTFGAVGWNNRFFYQEVTAAGALQNFQEFPGQSVPGAQDLAENQIQPAPSILISGGSIYWGIRRRQTGTGPNPYAAIYIGTPVINPVWTETGNIDTGALASPNQNPFDNPVLTQIGGTIYASFLRSNQAGSGTQIQAISTLNGFATFAPATLTDTALIGPNAQLCGPFLLSGIVIGSDGYVAEGSQPPVSFTSLGVTPTPPLNPLTIPGGGPPAILCPRPINRYDLCALEEVLRTKRIHFPPSCTIPRNLLAWEEDGDPTPAQAVPFNVQGTITTPATAAGDVLVCSGRVPLGYDGLLTDFYQTYQGSGFQQGSGDIVWRIRRNQVWLKQLGNNPFSLGNPRNPVGMTEGEIMFSGTQFFFFVNVPNLSGMIQIGGSLISCGMRGFYWPRG